MSFDWSELYKSTYVDVVRYLYRKVWDRDRAQDIAQDVFVRVLNTTPENPRALLFTVARNLAKDESRVVLRRKRHLALLGSDAQAHGVAAESADKLAERREESMLVERALAELSDRDREVLLLWDAGLSYAEIAKETGLAISAIGTTLARARSRLVSAYATVEGEDHVARG